MSVSSVDIQVPVAAPGVLLVWGDGSVTTCMDGGFGRSFTQHNTADPLLRKLMVARLRFIADEIEVGLEEER